MRDFTIFSNTNGLGLRSNAIKDLCPLILHQLVVGWIGKAHGSTLPNLEMNVMGLLSLHEDIFKQSEKVLNNMQLKISVITKSQKKGTTMVKKDRIDSDHKF